MRKTIYELNLFEAVMISKEDVHCLGLEFMKRVPGGWLYIIPKVNVVTFIPFSNINHLEQRNMKFKVDKNWTSMGVKDKTGSELNIKEEELIDINKTKK